MAISKVLKLCECNDKDVFSHFISDDFDSYTFYAKNFLQTKTIHLEKATVYPFIRCIGIGRKRKYVGCCRIEKWTNVTITY